MSEELEWRISFNRTFGNTVFRDKAYDIRFGLNNYQEYLRKAMILEDKRKYLDDIKIPSADAWEISSTVAAYEKPFTKWGPIGAILNFFVTKNEMKDYVKDRTAEYENLRESPTKTDLVQYMSHVPHMKHNNAKEYLKREILLKQMANSHFLVKGMLERDIIKRSEYDNIISYAAARRSMGKSFLKEYQINVFAEYLFEQSELNGQRFAVASCLNDRIRGRQSTPEQFEIDRDTTVDLFLMNGYEYAKTYIDLAI